MNKHFLLAKLQAKPLYQNHIFQRRCKMIQKKIPALVFILLFVLAACGQKPAATEAPPVATNVPAATNMPAPTATATEIPTETPIPPTATPEVQQFFTEKFQDGYEKNWSYFLRSGEETDFALSVESDGLLFALTGTRIFSYLVYQPFDYEEVRVEAIADNRGVNDNNVTLFCRYSPDGGWYEFNVFNSGIYNAYFTKPDSVGNLNYGLITEGGSNAIKQGKATNTYALVCKKDSLSFYINGDSLKTIPLPAYVPPGGKVGISVSSYGQVPVQVLVTELTISQP
jgi:hypothetical protein